MPPSPETPPAAHWQALITFLHGIEPRAWIFAASQCGDAQVAAQAFEGGLRDFVTRSRSLPLAQWPMQFWASLLGQPRLLTGGARADALGELPPGPRAALLLRLIAGLDFSHASQALGVSSEAYQAALRQALDHPGMDDARMQALREQLHEQIHQMPDARRQALAGLRTQALADALGHAPTAAIATTPAHARPGIAGWQWAVMALVLAGVLAATLWPRFYGLKPGQRQALPEEAVPPPPGLTDTIVATHPDYLQLAAPELEEIGESVAWLSWLAAASPPLLPATRATRPRPVPDSWQELGATERVILASAAATWTALDRENRAMLVEQAADWQSRTALQRAELRERVRRWDAQPATERARRRVAFLAWRQLNPYEQQRVRAAAAHVKALTALQRKELRDQFEALPADAQRLWAMGPALGQELAPIASLFAFMPEDERPALLAALRSLDGTARADLLTLAPRLDEAQRRSLRKELITTSADRRPALIRARLAQ